MEANKRQRWIGAACVLILLSNFLIPPIRTVYDKVSGDGSFDIAMDRTAHEVEGFFHRTPISNVHLGDGELVDGKHEDTTHAHDHTDFLNWKLWAWNTLLILFAGGGAGWLARTRPQPSR